MQFFPTGCKKFGRPGSVIQRILTIQIDMNLEYSDIKITTERQGQSNNCSFEQKDIKIITDMQGQSNNCSFEQKDII